MLTRHIPGTQISLLLLNINLTGLLLEPSLTLEQNGAQVSTPNSLITLPVKNWLPLMDSLEELSVPGKFLLRMELPLQQSTLVPTQSTPNSTFNSLIGLLLLPLVTIINSQLLMLLISIWDHMIQPRSSHSTQSKLSLLVMDGQYGEHLQPIPNLTQRLTELDPSEPPNTTTLLKRMVHSLLLALRLMQLLSKTKLWLENKQTLIMII